MFKYITGFTKVFLKYIVRICKQTLQVETFKHKHITFNEEVYNIFHYAKEKNKCM